MKELLSDLKRQYDTFPYPHYPLWIPLQWQESYRLSARYCRLLAEQTEAWPHEKNAQPFLRGSTRSAFLGCGDTQPVLARHWQAKGDTWLCNDLSPRTLQRLRWRAAINLQTHPLHAGDLQNLLAGKRGEFDHIECSGVLHHLNDPLEALIAIKHSLKPQGTLRLMVYNPRYRGWIRSVQRWCQRLELDYLKPADLKAAYTCVLTLGRHIAPIGNYLMSMRTTLRQRARFVDTFMHSCEINWTYDDWCKAFKQAGLLPLSLRDNRGELDHLVNPLIKAPSASVMDREENRSFSSNFDWILTRDVGDVEQAEECAHQRPNPMNHRAEDSNRSSLTPLKSIKAKQSHPPSSWFSASETKNIAPDVRLALWHDFLCTLFSENPERFAHRGISIAESLNKQLDLATIKRLRRSGYIGSDRYSREWDKPLLTTQSSTTQHLTAQKDLASPSQESIRLTPRDLKELSSVIHQTIRLAQRKESATTELLEELNFSLQME